MKKLALVLPQKTGGTHIEKMLSKGKVDFVFLPSLTEGDAWSRKTRQEREVIGLVNPKHFSFSGFDSDQCTINKDIASDYIKVGLIRNPYTWINSWMFHNMDDRITRWKTEDLRILVKRFCTGYVPIRQKNTMVNACEDYPMHHVFNSDGTVACDFLIFNENLNDGINKILETYGSDFRVEASEKTLVGNWSPDETLTLWNDEMKQGVKDCFGDFLDLFGYAFPGECKIESSLIEAKGLKLNSFKRMR